MDPRSLSQRPGRMRDYGSSRSIKKDAGAEARRGAVHTEKDAIEGKTL